jgi:hypothetical protein
MPYTAKDASGKTHKANTPRKRRVWAEIANRELAGGASEASAIRQANAVVARMKHGKR